MLELLLILPFFVKCNRNKNKWFAHKSTHFSLYRASKEFYSKNFRFKIFISYNTQDIIPNRLTMLVLRSLHKYCFSSVPKPTNEYLRQGVYPCLCLQEYCSLIQHLHWHCRFPRVHQCQCPSLNYCLQRHLR